MHRFLHVLAGPDVGKRLMVSDSFTTLLGRSKHANTQLADMSVSRVHCEIEIRGKRVFLADLESASGTFVNNTKVAECELRDNDVVRIGDTQMRLENPEVAEAKTIAPENAIPARPVLTSNRLPDLSGHKLSHFDVGKVLARGESGLVFQARDFKNDRAVAFKILWPEFSQNEDDMQRFIRTVKTMVPLQHPNLVRLYGAGKTGPYCWIAMELVPGESLTQVIQRIGAASMLDWKRVIRIGFYLSKALEYAHGQSIVHRNITPQNVLVGATPELTKLGDLMLAKAQEGSLSQNITKPGEILGDLRYMAPERTAGTSVDARSDLYSLGALMYVLLTGRPPFEGANLIETITKIRQAEPVNPKKYQLSIPDQIEGLVLKLLAKRPDDRYASATALIADMQRIGKFNGLNF